MESVSNEDFFSIDLNAENGFLLPAVAKLGEEIINKISMALHLPFVNENEATGEVCFANQPGLRPEFRQSFTATDLLNYIYAALQTRIEQDGEFLKTGIAEIPYPTNADDFWRLVQTGGRLR